MQTGIAGVNVGTAVFPAEDGPFGKDRKAIQRSGPGDADYGISKDPVVEGHIDAVMIPVEGYGLHIYICIEQFRAADPGVGAGIQKRLGAGGQIDPQILDAVLVTAGIGDLAGMDGHGLAQLLRVAAQGVQGLI